MSEWILVANSKRIYKTVTELEESGVKFETY